MFWFGKKNKSGSFSLETSKKVAYSHASSRPQVDGIVKKEKIITEEVKSVSVPIEIPKKVTYSRTSSHPQVDGIIRRKKIVTKDREDTVDNNKRTFLKIAGTTGLGLAAVTLLPKSASAYVAGSTPTSNVVGVKNSSNTRINPATEETVSTLATEATTATLLKTSDLTFDAGSLQVKVTSLPAGDGSSSFSDSGDVDKKGLVDGDRHVQVDVLSSELPSSASTETTLQTISFGGFKFTLRLTTVGSVDYVGEAAIGTATSSASWRIKKIDSTSGIILQWAGTGTFDQIWDNYASLSYS